MSTSAFTSAQNQSDLQASVNRVIAKHASTRPVNTIKQYTKKQQEFKEWCTSVRRFDDGYLVTEQKLILYLEEFVLPRGNQRKRKDDGTPVPLGKEAVEAYAKAVVDLYKLQQSLQINPHAHPRGKALKAFFEVQIRGETQRKRDQYVDRGIGTVLDGYNIPDMQCLSDYWLRLGSGTAMRDRVDFLLGHALLARGESKRFIELPDLLSLELLDEGPQRCYPLVVIMHKGKTNQVGRIEYGAALRHKEALLCPVGAVAFYLFWRWQVEHEPFPDMSERQRWYNIRLLKGHDREKDISYTSQLEGVKKAFKACGIDSSVWTHANRGSAAKLAEAQGADEAQIRRAGRWNGEKMEGCYLTTLPKKAMRALAGFGSKTGVYWLARASVNPPQELQLMLFPEVETWEARLTAANAREIAGRAFLQLLQRLRCVLLQDAVLLMARFPSHPMWTHPAFNNAMFAKFASRVIDAVNKARQEPLNNTLEMLPKNVASALDEGFKSVHARLDSLDRSLQQLTERPPVSTPVHYVLQPVEAPPLVGTETFSALRLDPTEQTTSAQPVPHSTPTHVDFKLSRALQTVAEVWREYSVGIGGNPAVTDVERVHGSRWRQYGTECRFFNRRKIYYESIAQLSQQHAISNEEASDRLELHRRTLGLSLNKFAAYLRSSASQ